MRQNPPVSSSLQDNMAILKGVLKPDENDDIVLRHFTALGQRCAMLYVEGMSSGMMMAQHILRPLMRYDGSASGDTAKRLVLYKLVEVVEADTADTFSEAVDELFCGQCLLLMDSVKAIFLFDTRSFVKRNVSSPKTESVVIGPQEAFNEALRDNLTLLHRKLHTPKLICRVERVGCVIPTQVALCYVDGVCRQETVDTVLKRLHGAAVDHVMSSGMLQQIIEDEPFALLPQFVATERPDRAVSFLLEGQLVVIVDGSPLALATPASIWHLFHAPDDNAMRWQYGTFLRLVRLFGAFCALLLPALFIALTLYHPMIVPMTLLTSIMESRTTVPISLYGETLLMVFLFNLINEAGTRVPGLMGSSLGLVSALILGTAAVDAGLVSPLLIIVVALGGLGSYAVPDYSLSLAFRILQLILVIISGIFGLPGVLAALMAIVFRLAGMRSLDTPYMAPNAPERPHNPDLILRSPIFRQRLRTYIANPSEMLRAHGRMRRFRARGGRGRL